jgi:hypothetical protein
VRIAAWPCAAPGGSGEEFALIAGPDEPSARVVIVPALFEEANRTRRMLVETMRALSAAGIASVLPDLPGCSESLAPLEQQDLGSWRAAMARAAGHFAASHLLTLRGGAVVAPDELPGWRLEPIGSAQVLRPLLRARTLSSREEGRSETTEGLLEQGRKAGVELAGYQLGPAMVRDLEAASAPDAPTRATLTLAELGGAPLWLRSEPGDDPALSSALAARMAADLQP